MKCVAFQMQGFLPHSCMSPFLLRLLSVSASIFFILVTLVLPPFLRTAIALSSPFIFFFLSFLLHGDSLLYKCKYFFSSAVSGLLVYVFVLHLPLYCLVNLLGDCSAIHLHLQMK